MPSSCASVRSVGRARFRTITRNINNCYYTVVVTRTRVRNYSALVRMRRAARRSENYLTTCRTVSYLSTTVIRITTVIYVVADTVNCAAFH